MAFVPWLEFWREFWGRPEPCKLKSTCNLDELAEALLEYLESAREVAVGAAKNVEDAERMMKVLNELIERRKKAAQLPH